MNNVSPVTETPSMDEIKSWLDRIATAFVGLSSQARELERLRQTMQEVSSRLDEVSNENTRLKGEIRDTFELVTTVERERDEAKRQVQVGETQNNFLRDENKRKDEAIANLESEVRRLTDSIAVANSEAQDWQGKAQVAEHETERAKQSRDYWRSEAERNKQDNDTLCDHNVRLDQLLTEERSKLSSVQAKLAEVSSLFAPAEQKEPKEASMDWAKPYSPGAPSF